MRRGTGADDEYLDASRGRVVDEFHHARGRPVRARDSHFAGDAELLQHLHGRLHRRRVTLGAHQDQDIRHSEMWKSGHMEYGNLQSFLADVATVLHPLKGYQPNSLIRSI